VYVKISFFAQKLCSPFRVSQFIARAGDEDDQKPFIRGVGNSWAPNVQTGVKRCIGVTISRFVQPSKSGHSSQIEKSPSYKTGCATIFIQLIVFTQLECHYAINICFRLERHQFEAVWSAHFSSLTRRKLEFGFLTDFSRDLVVDFYTVAPLVKYFLLQAVLVSFNTKIIILILFIQTNATIFY